MKIIASILAVCVLLLNTGNLLENMHSHDHAEIALMESCSDQDSSCCDTEEKHQDHNLPCNADHDCTTGCNCSCGLHFAALIFEFMELNGVVVQSYHYGNYLNTYTFEYLDDFLQPPRKA